MNKGDLINKVEEELQELKVEIKSNNKEAAERELGDLLFSIAQVARHLDLDAETALRDTNKRFESRYFKMMDICTEENLDWGELSDPEKEALWDKAKKLTHSSS